MVLRNTEKHKKKKEKKNCPHADTTTLGSSRMTDKVQ